MSKIITTGALCTGCGACENICPKSCVIRIKEDAGFQMQKVMDALIVVCAVKCARF